MESKNIVRMPFDTTVEPIVGGATTVTRKDFASLKFGTPLSVTRTVMLLVVFASSTLVGQVKIPFVALMPAPAGAPESRLKAKIFSGRSGSVAEFVKTSVVPA